MEFSVISRPVSKTVSDLLAAQSFHDLGNKESSSKVVVSLGFEEPWSPKALPQTAGK